jgi:cell division protein FtsI (penicillin-binding protein 3)/stage V sporulation protein D (sporulation-specific penicillin-binding protein)
VGLVERRIGLLFAVFLGMLLLAGARAGWLGVVKADSLKDAAATQQKSDITVPARRGTITDVNGTELAVSQPAQTIAATPYLIKDPADAARNLGKRYGSADFPGSYHPAIFDGQIRGGCL